MGTLVRRDVGSAKPYQHDASVTGLAPDRQRPASMVPIYAALVAYALGVALFPPRVLTVVDEDRYVSQALAFAQGRATIEGSGIIIPPAQVPAISDYPPGTSLLQTPFVWALGWRGAVIPSVMSLICATLFVAAWLRDRGKPPAYALLLPAFAGALTFGRIAMSDMPAGALVALAAWLLWRAEEGGRWLSLAVGLVAGLAILFREPLILVLVPLLAGAILRGNVDVAALTAGALVGLIGRLAVSQALFGDPFYVRDPDVGFSLGSLAHSVPVYALILGLMIPGGFILPFLYNGDRRPELLAAIGAYVGLFLVYDYDVIRSNGLLKGLMLASRFMIPIVPLLIWMAADVWSRTFQSVSGGWRAIVLRLRVPAMVTVPVMCFAIHPVARAQERDVVRIVHDAFENTDAATPVITNSDATLKYLSAAYGNRRLILRQRIQPDTVPELMRQFGVVDVALLNRTDSEMFGADAVANDRFVDELSAHCHLVPRKRSDLGWASFRVLRIMTCPDTAAR